MARRVRHYSDAGNFYNYYQEHNEAPKTLCMREMTQNYAYTAISEDVTCSRCLKKLEKQQMLTGQRNGRTLRITTVRDIGSCGDDKVDLYLQRLGIG
jgi:hypothetical protein